MFQIIWQLKSILKNDYLAPQMWPFNFSSLTESNTWFDALTQVILSTQVGQGSLPIIVGKLVHKGMLASFKQCLSTSHLEFNFQVTF